MMLLKEPKQIPKILVWYYLTPVGYDEFDNVLEWEKTPIRYSDGINVYTTVQNETQYVFNPQLVYEVFNDLCARDDLYNSVGLLIQSIVGQKIPIFRQDVDGKVIIGIMSEFIHLGTEVYTQVMSEFGSYVTNGKLAIVWGDYLWDNA